MKLHVEHLVLLMDEMINLLLGSDTEACSTRPSCFRVKARSRRRQVARETNNHPLFLTQSLFRSFLSCQIIKHASLSQLRHREEPFSTRDSNPQPSGDTDVPLLLRKVM